MLILVKQKAQIRLATQLRLYKSGCVKISVEGEDEVIVNSLVTQDMSTFLLV